MKRVCNTLVLVQRCFQESQRKALNVKAWGEHSEPQVFDGIFRHPEWARHDDAGKQRIDVWAFGRSLSGRGRFSPFTWALLADSLQPRL